MDKFKLLIHNKYGDTFYTPFTDPKGFGESLHLTNWFKDSLPDYLWIGLVIFKLGRKEGLKKLYQIIRELKSVGLVSVKMSDIIRLSNDKQEVFWGIVGKYVDKTIFRPLTIVITPDVNEFFYNLFYDFFQDIDHDISKLLTIIKQCVKVRDKLSTDICFVVVWSLFIDGRMVVSEELNMLKEALTEYYKHDHQEECMQIYGSVLRSTFQIVANNESDKKFPNSFWRRLGELSECSAYKIDWKKEAGMSYLDKATEIMVFISANNEEKKLETKYSVIMGMTTYIYKIYKEIVEKDLENCIGGRVLFRTMLETFITLKYLIMKEDDDKVYEKYKAYGIGKYKLIMAKVREGKYSINNKTQFDEKLMELLVNEEMDEAFINISVGYFDRINVKEKFVQCGEEKLYEIYYEYSTNYTHGQWGAIRESSLLACDNPAHNYHSIPDYYDQQRVKSVLYDCEMIMKRTFGIIKEHVRMPELFEEEVVDD